MAVLISVEGGASSSVNERSFSALYLISLGLDGSRRRLTVLKVPDSSFFSLSVLALGGGKGWTSADASQQMIIIQSGVIYLLSSTYG